MKKFIFLALAAVGLSLSLFQPAKVSAAENATWVDATTISFRDKLYHDSNPYDSDRRAEKIESGCRSTIFYRSDRKSATADIKTFNDFCPSDSEDEHVEISFVNAQTGFVVAYRQDASVIRIYDRNNNSGTIPPLLNYKSAPSRDQNTYYKDNNGRLDEGNSFTVNGGEIVDSDGISGIKGMRLANNGAVATQPQSLATATPSNTSGSQDAEKSCESAGGIAWLLCGIINAIDSALGWVDDQITTLLNVDRNAYDNPSIQTAWRNIRNIAYIILVPIMLVMVIGTAIGADFISAYTVKRALPRLVAATIFISLSYPFSVFLIELTNDIGAGILGLFTAPFTNNYGPLTLDNLFGTGSTGAVIQTIMASGALTIGIVALILFFTAPLFMLAATAFLIILARQMFLVAFVMLSPLAILAWIFPGKDKLWKAWWGSFSKLLVMFPLIMIVIAAGRIFAFIIMPPGEPGQGALQGAILQPLMALAAYILPYAAIPFTFKVAGGIFGTLTGMVNDKEKGFFDRQREKRKAKRERFGREQAINPDSALGKSRFGKFANKAGSWGVAPLTNARYQVGKTAQSRGIGFLSGMGGDIRSSLHHKAMENTGKLSQELQANGMMNDKALAAIAGQHTALSAGVQEQLKRQHPKLFGKALTSRGDIDKVAHIMQQYGNDTTETIGGSAMMGFADTIAGKYKNDELAYGNVAAAAGMEWSRQGFASGAQVSSIGNSLMESGMDRDTAQAMVSRMQLLGQQSRPDLKMGYGVMFDRETGQFVDGRDYTYTHTDEKGKKTTKVRGDDLVKTIKQTDWLGAKSMAVEKLHDNIKRVASETVKDKDGNITYTPEARAMQEQIALGASQFSSSDVGAKVEWTRLVDELNLRSQLSAIDAAQKEQQERQAGAGGPSMPGGGDAGGGGGGASAGGGGGAA